MRPGPPVGRVRGGTLLSYSTDDATPSAYAPPPLITTTIPHFHLRLSHHHLRLSPHPPYSYTSKPLTDNSQEDLTGSKESRGSFLLPSTEATSGDADSSAS